MQIPLLRAFWVEPFLQHFGARGESVGLCLESETGPGDVSDLPCPARHVHQAVDRLIETAGGGCGCEIGYRVGRQTGIRRLGAFGRRTAAAPTLREAIHTAAALMPAVHSARTIGLTSGRRRACLSSRVAESGAGPTGWEDGFVAALLIDIVRLAAGDDWRPALVSIQSPRQGYREFRDELDGVKVRYGQSATAIELPIELLDRPLPSSDDRPVPTAGLEPFPEDPVGRVRLVLEFLLRQVEDDLRADVAGVAALVGTSRRSLQRHLALREQSFKRMLEQARRDRALRLLDRSSSKVIDVAFELGYNDPSHFTRAFRRWTGVAPRTYQQVGL